MVPSTNSGVSPTERTAVEPRDRIASPRAWLVWALATLFVVWIFTIQTGYAVVSPAIQADAHLSLSQISSAAAVYTLTFAIFQTFSGALLDRFGSRPLLVIAMALVAGGAFLYAGTSSIGTLLLAQVVLALGASFGFVGAGYLSAQWFAPARFGVMFALVQACSSAGSAVAQPLIQAALTHITWTALLVGFGVFGIALTVVSAVVIRDPAWSGDHRREQAASSALLADIGRGLGACLRTPAVLAGAALAGTSFGAVLAIGTLWGPRVLAARGAGVEDAALLNGAAWLGVALGAPLINIVSDRLRRRAAPAVVAVLLQALFVAAIVYLPTSATGSTAVAAALMFSAGLAGGVNMLGFAVAGENAPRDAAGRPRSGSASALVNATCFVLAALLQSAPTWFLPGSPELSDYQKVLWIVPVLLVLGALAAARFPKTTLRLDR